MRILLLMPSYPSDGSTAGTFHKTQAESLARLGAEVEVIAPVPWVPFCFECLSAKWALYKKIPSRSRTAGVSVLRPRYIQPPRGDYLARPHRSYARIAKTVISWRPDVIHAHFAYPCGLAAFDLGRAWNVPYLLTLHGSDVNTYPLANRLARHRFVAAVRGAGRVLAVSGALSDRTEQIAGRRPEVLPIGIDLRLFCTLPGRTRIRAELGIPCDKRIVLFVGTLAVTKGVRELILALATLRKEGVMGVFVGDGPLRSEVRACPDAIWEGNLTNHDLVKYYNLADVFVLPSYSEGMPTVLAEAGSVGLPVIGTSVGGIPVLLGSGRGLIIPPRDATEIASCVRTVLADSHQSAIRARALKDYICDNYDCDKNATELLKIYNSTLR